MVDERARSAPRGTMCLVLRALALAILVALPAVAPPPAAGANLTSRIAATRRSQILYESAMRFQDGRLKELNRARKVARHRLAKISALLDRVAVQRVVMRGRVESAKSSRDRVLHGDDQALGIGLELSRGRSASDYSSEDVTLLEQTLMADAFAEGPGDAVRGSDDGREVSRARRISRNQLAIDALRVRVRTIGRRSVGAGRDGRGTARGSGALTAEVERLERGLKRLNARKHRIQRRRKAATKRIMALQREIATARSSRNAAEALLAGQIRAMGALAHRRAVKKTDVRPGRDSAFVWPARGRITQRFSAAHDGLDIAAARGSPIRAAAVGVVAYVGWNPWDRGRRAFVIVVGHPGGLETVYGHLLPIRRVTVGQLVRKGQLIGFMGNTGHSTGVHLHIEISRGFRQMNPLAFLPG